MSSVAVEVCGGAGVHRRLVVGRAGVMRNSAIAKDAAAAVDMVPDKNEADD